MDNSSDKLILLYYTNPLMFDLRNSKQLYNSVLSPTALGLTALTITQVTNHLSIHEALSKYS